MRKVVVIVLVAVWGAVKPLLHSKKFQTAIVTAVTAGVTRLGFDIDANTVTLIISPLLAAILGQGVADLKKPCPQCAAGVPSAASSHTHVPVNAKLEGGGPPTVFGELPPVSQEPREALPQEPPK